MPVADRSITIHFADGTVTGNGGCNSYVAPAHFDAGRFVTGEFSVGTQTCDPQTDTMEARYLQAIGDATTVRVIDDGHRLATGEAITLQFGLQESPDLRDVVGHSWVLVEMAKGSTIAEAAGPPATLMIGSDQRLMMTSPCRTYAGSYVVTGNEVRLVSLEATGECEKYLDSQDAIVSSVIGDGFTISLSGGSLVLTGRGGWELHFR